MYRGKNITSDWNSGAFSTNVANGSYKNIFPGDYIRVNITFDGVTQQNYTFYVCDCNYYANNAVVMIPEGNLTTGYMNSTTTTAGGYIGSYGYKKVLPKFATCFQSAFGTSHVKSFSQSLPDKFISTTNGTPNGWSWYSQIVTLLSETQVYGNSIWSVNGYEQGYDNSQLAIFRFDKNMIRLNSWLRNVSSHSSGAGLFCIAYNNGSASSAEASASGFGFRPIFTLA